MPPSSAHRAFTVNPASFEPDDFFEAWNASSVPQTNDLRTSINKAFRIEPNDDYVYHAVASVTLAQVQVAIDHGDVNGMHAWYRDEKGEQIPPPPSVDITAYTQVFAPSTSTAKAITALSSNAKKGSIRASIAEHLNAHFLPPLPWTKLALPAKQKNAVKNPSFDMWAWSCQCLEWAGPNDQTVNVRQSHHILPVFYHHFGCVCPSWDALSLLQQLSNSTMHGRAPHAAAKPIVEIGSGNGYWTYMLRRLNLEVYPVDNAASTWRTTWIGDTIIADGIQFLQKPPARIATAVGGAGCKHSILLLVYPQVSSDFTGRVIRAFEGTTIVVAGTQNRNGFTGFMDEEISAWMGRERPAFERICQIPLPSFAGKDEALFVFMRK